MLSVMMDEIEPTHCSDCGDALNEHARAGRCSNCNARARAKYYAGVFAATARPGLVVDERLTASYAQHVPAALARRGLLLERDALQWVVRRAP